MPLFVAAPFIGEGGQPTGEVGPVVVAIEVAPSTPSSILVKRKKDDAAGLSSCKKLKDPMSLRALRQAIGLGPTAGHLMTMQDVPPAPPAVEAPSTATTTPPTSTPSPP